MQDIASDNVSVTPSLLVTLSFTYGSEREEGGGEREKTPYLSANVSITPSLFVKFSFTDESEREEGDGERER